MKRSFLISMRCTMALAVMLAVWLAAATPVHAAGTTARTALESAIEAAKQWRPDAILSSVYTAGADIDGKSTSWSYGFYSPKAGSYLNVAARGRSLTTLEIGVGQNDAVPADFLDSDLAVAAATKAGIKADSLRMRLTKTQWLVNSGDQKGALTIWLNPRTGRLIKTQRVQ